MLQPHFSPTSSPRHRQLQPSRSILRRRSVDSLHGPHFQVPPPLSTSFTFPLPSGSQSAEPFITTPRGPFHNPNTIPYRLPANSRHTRLPTVIHIPPDAHDRDLENIAAAILGRRGSSSHLFEEDRAAETYFGANPTIPAPIRPGAEPVYDNDDFFSIPLQIHRLLDPDYQEETFTWDMRFAPEGNVRRYQGYSVLPFTTFNHEPCTYPKLDQIEISSIHYPWTITVQASNRLVGVTFDDLMGRIHFELDQPLLEEEWRGTTPHHQQHILSACRVREELFFPCTFRYQNIKKIDWLAGHTAFCGLVDDKEYAPEYVETSLGGVVMLLGIPKIEIDRRLNCGI
ncbi:hypothetical protein C8J56DRAFT_933920 [Mycena floridula]|nr:hypothetical protein C8J56DRAFT_933920 [Mycena floridula]